MKRHVKQIAVVIGVTVLGFLSICYLMWNCTRIREWGVAVEYVDLDWLPDGVTTVTFVSSDIQKVAEFTIDRKVFESWCKAQGKPLGVLAAGQEEKIWRANRFLGQMKVIEEPRDVDEYIL